MIVVPAGPARAEESICPFGSATPSQVTIVVEGEVDKMDIWQVCLQATYTDDMLREFGVTLSGTTIYIVDTVERAQRRMPAPAGRKWGVDLGGQERAGRIVLLATSRRSVGILTVHELIHVVQEPVREAQWLAEGAATYLERRYIAEAGGNVDFTVDSARWDSVIGEVDLQSIESRRGFNSFPGSQSYNLAFVAFHLILTETGSGLDTYFNCFIPEKKVVSWKTAFIRCFDISISSVYVLMSEFLDTGFTEFPSERRERERLEFQQLVDNCLLEAVKVDGRVLRAIC